MIEKESSAQKSRRLSIINPSPEGSQNLTFSTESSEELDDWLDALHQHLFDQSECVSAKHAHVNVVETKVEDVPGKSKLEGDWIDDSPFIHVSHLPSLETRPVATLLQPVNEDRGCVTTETITLPHQAGRLCLQ